MEFFEAVTTLRAMRRLHPDPIPDDDLWKILDTAIRAPSGGNTQPWNFIVIRDQAAKDKIGAWYLDAWKKTYGPAREAMLADPRMAKTYHSADHLAEHLAEVPVLILATTRKDNVRVGALGGASIYPAVQNLMLAARALGYGTTLTTLHKLHDAEVKELVGVPDDHETMALIPIGKPRGRFGVPPRTAVDRVVHWERWGEQKTRA